MGGRAGALGLKRFVLVAAWLAIWLAISACESRSVVVTISPAPSAATSTVPSSRPSASSASGILMSATIPATALFDFEQGLRASLASADVWWQQVDPTKRFLVPMNGAALAALGPTQFERLSPQILANERLSQQHLDGSVGPSNVLATGSVVVIRTRHGRFAKMHVDAYGPDLRISWVTYQ